MHGFEPFDFSRIAPDDFSRLAPDDAPEPGASPDADALAEAEAADGVLP